MEMFDEDELVVELVVVAAFALIPFRNIFLCFIL